MSIERRQRRNPLHEEVDSEGSWAISYGDMITLLLTFFILFFNVDQRDSQTRLAVQESLIEKLKPLSQPSVEVGADRTPAGIEERELAKWGAKVHRLGERVVVEFPQLSFYEKGSTEVREEAAKKLLQFAKLYEPYMGSNVLGIRAFTDTLKVSSGKRYHDNLELSALRSISAMRVLQRAGIPLNLMRISGNGEIQSVLPVLDMDAFRVKGDPLSRKVVLVIEPATKDKL